MKYYSVLCLLINKWVFLNKITYNDSEISRSTHDKSHELQGFVCENLTNYKDLFMRISWTIQIFCEHFSKEKYMKPIVIWNSMALKQYKKHFPNNKILLKTYTFLNIHCYLLSFPNFLWTPLYTQVFLRLCYLFYFLVQKW